MIKEYGYEYDAVLDEKLWEGTKGKVTHEKLGGAYCLRSGRDALKAIAREYEPRTVFLPALSCNSMIMPFKQYGHTVKFYKLKKNFSIDFKDLSEKIESDGDLFLYMDYFGCKTITDLELEKLRERNLISNEEI